MRKTVTPIDDGSHRARVLERRDELVRDHLALVVEIARGIHRRLPPCFELRELIAVGNLGCWQATARYLPGAHNGTSFAGYARKRIRGAILESVRRKNWEESMRPGLTVFDRRGLEREIPELAVAGFDPTDIDNNRRALRVSAALAELPAPQREILEECYSMWEPTMRQVARRLRIGEGVLYARRRVALAALRALLKTAA